MRRHAGPRPCRCAAGPRGPGIGGQDAHVLLGSLLALEDLSATERGRVVEWSIAWLEHHHADGTAGTFAVQGTEELLGALLSLELDAAQVRRLDAHLRETEGAGRESVG